MIHFKKPNCQGSKIATEKTTLNRPTFLLGFFAHHSLHIQLIFSLNWPTGPIQSWSRCIRLSVCVSVCLWQLKTPTSQCCEDFWSTGILLIFACNETITFSFFFVSIFFSSSFFYFFWVFRASLLWASLLWIMGELAGGGFVAVAVGVSDRETRHVPPHSPPRLFFTSLPHFFLLFLDTPQPFFTPPPPFLLSMTSQKQLF